MTHTILSREATALIVLNSSQQNYATLRAAILLSQRYPHARCPTMLLARALQRLATKMLKA